MKMRVLYYSKKKKIADLASYLSKNMDDGKEDVIPPAYTLQKERLLVLGVSVPSKLPDDFRRFFMTMSTDAVKNIAVFTDSTPEGVQPLIALIKDTGVNVIDDIYYVKSEFMSFKKATDEEKAKADEWFGKIQVQLK